MAKRQQENKTYNICVVGLSGTEREKGDVGIGKSCFCNRFMYALAQDYHTDHISVLSQSDFNGRVINNDHFLYWGFSNKREDGLDYSFHVIEQTEFVDDASFQPFRTGRIETYVKRCTSLKVHSDEKLMYICKGQLGMEMDSAYEQKLMPDRLSVDGFLCLFDVSTVPHRSFDKQLEFTSAILANISKIRKPVVLVTTKNDCAEDRFIREAEKLLTKKEFKGINIPLVETSSHENVNIDLAFFAVAHLIDKIKTKLKIIPFKEAWRARREIMDVAKDAYVHRLQCEVTDYKSQWAACRRNFEKNPDYGHYCDLWGVNSAKKVFLQHTRRLREELVQQREMFYLSQLPDILRKLLPSLGVIADRGWASCVRYLEHHQDHDRYFVDLNSDTSSWRDTDFIDDVDERRVPFDLLRESSAETCFKNHVSLLQAEYKKLELKRQFWQLLKDSSHVTPGKPLSEAYIFFVGKECFTMLNEEERQLVYDQYQDELRVVAYDDLHELLWEHSQLFMDINPSDRLTNSDFKQLTLAFEDDPRFKRLNCLEQDRKVRLLNHLGFMQCPSKERCYFRHGCVDYAVDELINKESTRSSYMDRYDSPNPTEQPLNLVLLGQDKLAFEVNKEIRVICPEDEYVYNNTIYSLDYRPIDGDVSLDQNAFTTANFKPNGCLCVYATSKTLDYITASLEFCLRWELTHDAEPSVHNTPVVIMPASNAELSEKDRESLREKGHQLANRLQCEFIDNPVNDDLMDGRLFSHTQIERALQRIIKGYNCIADFHRLALDNTNADLRVSFCLMCGDPFCPDIPLNPLLQHDTARAAVDVPCSLMLDVYLDDSKQTVEVVFCSYHTACATKSPYFHAYILVYSAKRRASFSTMRAFANTLPRIPILILAITDNGGTSAFFTNELVQHLLQEGNALADDLGAHFIASTANFQSQTAVYMPFFKEAWERRGDTDSLYNNSLDDTSPPPYEKTAMDRRPPMVVPPVPLPPNVYATHKSSTSNSTEDSEPLYDTPGHHYQSDSEHDASSLTSPPSTTDPTSPYAVSAVLYSTVDNQTAPDSEHVVRPSQLKNRRNLYAAWAVHEHHHDNAASVADDATSADGEWLVNSMYSSSDGKAFDNSKTASVYSPSGGNMDEWMDNSLYESTEDRRPKVTPKPLDMSKYSHLAEAATKNVPSSTGAGCKRITAPLALPEKIEIGDYAIVQDMVQENDYALVHDALPAGRLHRIKSARKNNTNASAHSDTDSDLSSQEQDAKGRDMYARANRKPTPHKKKYKNKPRDSGGGDDGNTSVEYRIILSQSASDGSDGTGDEILNAKKNRSHKTRSSVGVIGLRTEINSPQVSDSDHLTSPPTVSATFSVAVGRLEEDDNAYESISPRDDKSTTRMVSVEEEGDSCELGVLGKTKIRLRSMSKDPADKQRKKEEKEEKRVKEQERKGKEQERRKEKKKKEDTKKRYKKKDGKSSSLLGGDLTDHIPSVLNVHLPLFIEKCVEYIEEEGLHVEGLYRVPGNRAQVDTLIHSFKEDPSVDISSLDIQVNAVATALKSFFSDLNEPLIPCYLNEEFFDAARIPEKSLRLVSIRGVLKKLPVAHYEVLKYLVTHLTKVSRNSAENSMDCRNLAVCWWPTLIRHDIVSLQIMSEISAISVEIIYMLIEQSGFLFYQLDEV